MQCDCYDDDTNGHWKRGDSWPWCRECADGWTGPECKDKALYCTRDGQCSGHGNCTETDTCVCDEGFTGPFCQSCASGRYGPLCTPLVDLCNDATCGENGDCPAVDKLSSVCGSAVCGGDQECCQWQSKGQWEGLTWSFPNTLQTYQCADKASGQKCCGRSLCSYNDECVNEDYGKCCPTTHTMCTKKLANGTDDVTSANDIQCCPPPASSAATAGAARWARAAPNSRPQMDTGGSPMPRTSRTDFPPNRRQGPASAPPRPPTA